MTRLAVAALLGGIAMFVWGAISHMLTPLGEAGIRPLPAEAPVLDALRANVPEAGLYLFPGMDETARKTEAGQAEWAQRYAAGPVGILVFRPQGEQPMNAKLFGVELLGDVLAAAVAAWVATHGRTFGRRLALVTLLGLAAWASIEVSYWNWYGFPSSYVMAQLADQVGGFLFAGLVIAKLVRPADAAA